MVTRPASTNWFSPDAHPMLRAEAFPSPDGMAGWKARTCLAERARPRAQQVPTAPTRWIFPTALLLWTRLRPERARSAKHIRKSAELAASELLMRWKINGPVTHPSPGLRPPSPLIGCHWMRGEERVRGVARSQGISSLLGDSCGGSGCLSLIPRAIEVFARCDTIHDQFP